MANHKCVLFSPYVPLKILRYFAYPCLNKQFILFFLGLKGKIFLLISTVLYISNIESAANVWIILILKHSLTFGGFPVFISFLTWLFLPVSVLWVKTNQSLRLIFFPEAHSLSWTIILKLLLKYHSVNFLGV